MRHNVFRQTLREDRRTLLTWTIGLAGAAWLTLLARPLVMLIVGARALPGWLALLLGGADTLAEPGLWLRVVGFDLVLPLVLVVFTIRQGSRLVAGEEERSTLGLLLAAPLQRYRLILEKFAVLVLLALAPGAGLWLALSLLAWVGLLPTSAAALAGAAGVLFGVGLAFGVLAMALGSLTGKARLSFWITLALALCLLLISWLPGSAPVQPVLRAFSPFHYYHEALLNHSYWLNALVLFLIAAGGLILAWRIFEHRDLPV